MTDPTPVPVTPEVKPGYTTTEFWATMIPNLLTIVQAMKGTMPDKEQLLIIAILNGAYAALRTYHKTAQ